MHLAGLKVRLNGTLVLLAMAGEHGLGGGFEFAGLALKVGAGAATRFGGVAGELHAVYGKHLPAYQSLLVADE